VRCQRSSVWGVTRNDAQRSRESRRLAAASTIRSSEVNRGRPVLRRSTPKLMPQHQDLQVLGAVVSVWEHRSRVSRWMVNQSRKSIAGWYRASAHGTNPSFRAPHGAKVERNPATVRPELCTYVARDWHPASARAGGGPSWFCEPAACLGRGRHRYTEKDRVNRHQWIPAPLWSCNSASRSMTAPTGAVNLISPRSQDEE
jgi:hypothetical protein